MFHRRPRLGDVRSLVPARERRIFEEAWSFVGRVQFGDGYLMRAVYVLSMWCTSMLGESLPYTRTKLCVVRRLYQSVAFQLFDDLSRTQISYAKISRIIVGRAKTIKINRQNFHVAETRTESAAILQAIRPTVALFLERHRR